MLAALLGQLNNFFDRNPVTGRFHHVEGGELVVEGGELVGAGDWLMPGQWFRILGSRLNDGIHQHPARDLADEAFEGCAYALAVPDEVVELAGRIEAWEAEHGDASRSPFQSESFGGYSYDRGDDGDGGWQRAFAPELRRWRRL